MKGLHHSVCKCIQFSIQTFRTTSVEHRNCGKRALSRKSTEESAGPKERTARHQGKAPTSESKTTLRPKQAADAARNRTRANQFLKEPTFPVPAPVKLVNSARHRSRKR